MICELPQRVDVGGASYAIRSGYRAVLDVCAALTDPELSGRERAMAAICVFYPDYEAIPPDHLGEALERLIWFVNCGEERENRPKAPRLVDWEQDFSLIAGPVNRVLGTEIRLKTGPEDDGVHWWTFISAYQEIGECTFAQVVRIRDRKARGKPLDRQDRDWYRRNRDLVDFKTVYTQAEQDILREFGGL